MIGTAQASAALWPPDRGYSRDHLVSARGQAVARAPWHIGIGAKHLRDLEPVTGWRAGVENVGSAVIGRYAVDEHDAAGRVLGPQGDDLSVSAGFTPANRDTALVRSHLYLRCFGSRWEALAASVSTDGPDAWRCRTGWAAVPCDPSA